MCSGASKVMLVAILCWINLHFCIANLTVNELSTCPKVNFTCTLVDFPATLLRWFFNIENIATYTFVVGDSYPLTLDSESQIHDVEIQMLSASLSSNQQFSNFHSSLAVSIFALQEAGISSVGCGDLGRRTDITVPSSIIANDFQAPKNFTVQPEYSRDSELVNVLVQWNEVSSSNEFCFYPIDYTLELRGANPNTVSLFHIDSSNCRDGSCSYMLPIASTLSETYLISISANNSFLGTSAIVNFNGTIYGSIKSLFGQSLVYEDCITTAYCSTTLSEKGDCSVQYTEDILCRNLSTPIRGPLNSSLSLPLLKSFTSYCVQFTFFLNSEPTVLMTNFTTNNGISQFSSGHLGLIVIGIGSLLTSSIVALALVLYCFHRKKYVKGSIVAMIVGIMTVGIITALWVATIVYGAVQEDTCNQDWQQSREVLLIITFCLSLGSLVLVFSILFVVCLIHHERVARPRKNEFQLQNVSFEHKIPEALKSLTPPKFSDLIKAGHKEWVPIERYDVCQVCKENPLHSSSPHCHACGKISELERGLDVDDLVLIEDVAFVIWKWEWADEHYEHESDAESRTSIEVIPETPPLPDDEEDIAVQPEVVCSACSEKKAFFTKVGFYQSDEQQVCDVCYHKCKQYMGSIFLKDTEKKTYKKKFMMILFRLNEIQIFDDYVKSVAVFGKESLKRYERMKISKSEIQEVKCVDRPARLMCLQIVTKAWSYIMSCKSTSERDEWIKSIYAMMGYEYIIDVSPIFFQNFHLSMLSHKGFQHWTPCFVILTECTLLLFKSIEDDDPYNELQFSNKISDIEDTMFEFINPSDNSKVIFKAECSKDRDDWVKTIKKVATRGNNHRYQSHASCDGLNYFEIESDNFYHATSHRKPKPAPRLNYSDLALQSDQRNYSQIASTKENYDTTSFSKGASIGKSHNTNDRVDYSSLAVSKPREDYDVVDRSKTKKNNFNTSKLSDLSSYSHFTAPTQQYSCTSHKKRGKTSKSSQVAKESSSATYSHFVASSATHSFA